MSNAKNNSDFSARSRIPLWVKLAYTGFACVLVPHYLYTYGPTNFLYFCDVALLMALVAVWKEDALWASMPAVGILMPQALWMVDFLGGLLGFHVVGMTAYMFDPGIPLFARGLSLFHFWLPLFLLWIIWRLGYDRRAFVAWTAIAWLLMLVCYFLMPAPPAPPDNPNLPVNINYVYGPSDATPQQWMPPFAYLGLLMVGLPTCMFLPTHLILRSVFQESIVSSRVHASANTVVQPTRRQAVSGSFSIACFVLAILCELWFAVLAIRLSHHLGGELRREAVDMIFLLFPIHALSLTGFGLGIIACWRQPRPRSLTCRLGFWLNPLALVIFWIGVVFSPIRF